MDKTKQILEKDITHRNKILVVYGTKYGNTGAIATFIGKNLINSGSYVVVIDLGKNPNPDVTDYDLVIVGSGIVMANWYKSVIKFVKKNEHLFTNKKVAYFISCASVIPPCDREVSMKIYTERAEKYASIMPIAFGVFGTDFSHVRSQGILHKITMPALLNDISKKDVDIEQGIDFTNWKEIEGWTSKLMTNFAGSSTTLLL